MRIKTKLILGVGILFAMVLLMSVMGSRHIHILQKDISNILEANYHSLEYSRHMLKTLDEIQGKTASFEVFELYLNKQEANVTEIGEKELTEELVQHFSDLKNGPTSGKVFSIVRNDIFNIMKLNMEAIQRKSDMAGETASNATTWIVLTGSFSLLIALLVFLGLPSSITNPIKALDLAKTNFIANVSHELKTPVSSIQMSLQLMEDARTGPVNKSQKQLIESMRDDSNRILKITAELLNMSRVEAGNIQLDIQHVHPAGIIDIALEAVKVQAEQKRISLLVKIDKDVQAVRADMEKTAWVLINLLTNAMTYSPEGSNVEIAVHDLNGQVIFSIKDYGKGIEQQYRGRIFDRYFQVPGSHKSGTGLGLAISREFIEAQGGKISLESEIGSGSIFYFALPAK